MTSFFLFISIAAAVVVWPSFKGETVFNFDYEAQQEVVRNTNLYPHPILARTFHNKARIITDKIVFNLFALTDLNNYLFGFHPRQIVVENQNLEKFPFLSLVFLLIGIYYFKKVPGGRITLIYTVSGLLSLSLLNYPDRQDFILWAPISLLALHGLGIFTKKQNSYKKAFLLIFILFSIEQLIKNYVSFTQGL